MKKCFAFLFFVLTIGVSAFAQSPLAELDKVKELKLLESTRDDAVKLLAKESLGFSASSDYYSSRFYTNNAVVEVFYSTGDCSEEDEDWNVGEWKITKVAVTPKNSILIKDIGIDYSKFRQEKEFGKWGTGNDIYHNKTEGIAILALRNAVQKIIFIPSKNYYSLLCKKKEVKKYYSSKKWNRYPDWEKGSYDRNYQADVTNLELSQTEITADCNSSDSIQNNVCQKSTKEISVSTTYYDPANDVVTFNYYVSAGKIVGQGSKVIWNLSGVKAGTYKITAAVDDGCGLCGKFITKTVVVKECPDCQ